MAKSERKVQLIKDFETKISEVNKACTNGTNADVEGKLAELVNIEKEYRSIREAEVFAGLADTHQAIELHLSNDGRFHASVRDYKIRPEDHFISLPDSQPIKHMP